MVVKSHKTQGMFAATTDYSCRVHTSEHSYQQTIFVLCVHVVPSLTHATQFTLHLHNLCKGKRRDRSCRMPMDA